MSTIHTSDLNSIRAAVVHSLGTRLYHTGVQELRAQSGRRFAAISLSESTGLHIRARDQRPRTLYRVCLQGDALTVGAARAQADSLAQWLDADGGECGS